jgi:hypothetical protein
MQEQGSTVTLHKNSGDGIYNYVVDWTPLKKPCLMERLEITSSL